MSTGNNSKGPTPEHRVSDKNSDQEEVAPNEDKCLKNTKNDKANTVSPKTGFLFRFILAVYDIIFSSLVGIKLATCTM